MQTMKKQTMKKQSMKTTTRMGMGMTTTTVQLLLMATVAFFDLVHVAFLAPLRVRQKSPVDLALVVSAASLVGASRKSASLQRGSVIGHYVTKQENRSTKPSDWSLR